MQKCIDDTKDALKEKGKQGSKKLQLGVGCQVNALNNNQNKAGWPS
jgi:coenzyme F420-reducing hydrogenase beta subunit